MANSLFTNPMVLDTDIANFRTTTAATPSSILATNGIKPSKVVLAVGSGTSSAGTVTVTRPGDGAALYPPLIVAAATAANTELYVDDPSIAAPLNWNNFAVTGLTATGTKMYIWYNI